MEPIIFLKAHIDAYTKKDGTFVAAHEDRRPTARDEPKKEAPRGGVAATPEFKRWFGDSKAVDAEGKPLVVYHGSPVAGLDSISPGTREPGAWFTRDKKYANDYAKGPEGEIYEVYLSVKNPMVVTFDGHMRPQVDGEILLDRYEEPIDNNVDIVKYAMQQGYDGVHFPHGNFSEDSEAWVAFRSEQVKSATGNNGAFDPDDPDIRKSMRPIILFFKGHVSGYIRGGRFVKPYERKGGAAASSVAPGQLALFTKPATPSKPNPFKGKDPVASTPDMFDEQQVKVPLKEMIDEHKRLVQVLESPSHADDKEEAKKQRAELEEYKRESAQAGDGIEVRPGKGLIKDKFLADVDGEIVPGGPWNTPDEATAAAHAWRANRQQAKAEQVRQAEVKKGIADRIRAGGEPTDADLKAIGLRPGSSDLRWFIPAAADLFGISSRAVRPYIKDLIKVGHTDMGAKREYVGPKQALQAIAAGLGKEPEPRVLLTKPAKDLEGLIKIAADSIYKLRKDDVYRVLDQNADSREDLAAYISQKRPDLAQEVEEVMREEFGR